MYSQGQGCAGESQDNRVTRLMVGGHEVSDPQR